MNNNNNNQASNLNHFSWEEWDNQMIVVLYRSDRRYVVKRYVERVLWNSTYWQSLARYAFSVADPIPRAYILTDNEAKLMQRIFAWHLNGSLTFPIISGLDQLIEWEDLLDFIRRAEQVQKDDTRHTTKTKYVRGIVPTIPIGILPSKATKLKSIETNNIAGNSELTKENPLPNTTTKNVPQQRCFKENPLPSFVSYKWVQVNCVCSPCITKAQHSYLLPYQVLLDCDLLNEKEQSLLIHLTVKANGNDIKILESIIASSSTPIDFKLDDNLLLIDLYDLLFGMSKVVYVQLLNNQRDVNRKYKTVLAQSGGTAMIRCQSIPFINIGKCHYVLLETLLPILQPKTKNASILRQQSVVARSYEIEYLRLIELYQRKYVESNSLGSNQEQLILNFDEIDKYVTDSDLVIDMLLPQYQKLANQKLKKHLDLNEKSVIRKPTKRIGNTIRDDASNSMVD